MGFRSKNLLEAILLRMDSRYTVSMRMNFNRNAMKTQWTAVDLLFRFVIYILSVIISAAYTFIRMTSFCLLTQQSKFTVICKTNFFGRAHTCFICTFTT